MTVNDRPLDRGVPSHGNSPLGTGGPFGTFGHSGQPLGGQPLGGQQWSGQPWSGAQHTGQLPGGAVPGGQPGRGQARPAATARPDDVQAPDTGVPGTGGRLVDRARRRTRRGSLTPVVSVVLLVVLLVPVAVLFVRQWNSTGDARSATADERAAVAYARPVDKLLSVLLDAQATAVRKGNVDPAVVQAAADNVDAVDRGGDDTLQVRSRWTQLRHEIDTAVAKKATGLDAIATYASPIALTQALLTQLAESTGIGSDPAPGATQLTQVALRDLPDVLANAAGLAARVAVGPTSGGNGQPDAQFGVLADRLATAADDVGTGLRAGTDPGANYAIDLSLLAPLDAFSAAADALNQTAAALDTPGSGARDRIAAATTLLQGKALDLQSAVLTTFDNQLAATARDYSGQQRELTFAAIVIALAAVALLWLGVRTPRPRTEPVEEPAGYSDGGVEVPRPVASARTPDLVDARQLIPSQLVPANRGVPTARRQGRDDSR